MKSLKAKIIAPREFDFIEEDLPPLTDTQVLIKVISCGVCSSEIPVYNGDVIGTRGVSFRYKSYPADLGHEVVGEVVDLGKSVHSLTKGAIVTGLTYSGCGFSTYFVEESDMLIELPRILADAYPIALGEPLMATVNILNQMSLQFGSTIVVVGDGFMSLLLIAALARYPLEQLIVVGHHSHRLNLAAEYGATLCINGKNQDSWQSIMDATNGQGVNVSVEYAGTSKSMQLAASICKPKQRAQLVLAAAYDNNTTLSIGNYMQNRAPILIPAYPNHSMNKQQDLERGVWGMATGIFPMHDLVTHRYDMLQIDTAFTDCIQRSEGYIKGIVMPEHND